MKYSRSMTALALVAAVCTGTAAMAQSGGSSGSTGTGGTTSDAPGTGSSAAQGANPATPGASDSDSSAAGGSMDSGGSTGTTGTMGTASDNKDLTNPGGAPETQAATLPPPDALGKDVVNQAGETVGEIDDIVTEESSNDVYAVVSVGGFLGMGDKRVLVPIDQIDVGGENAVLMSQGSEEELKNMPAYEEGAGYRSMKEDQGAGSGSQ